MIWRAAALLCTFAGGAAAQTADDVAQAVEAWLSTHNANGVIAIQTPEDQISVVDLGLPVGEPVELASLSKAITAVCTATLVEDRLLRWTDPVSNYVPGFDTVTVGDLVTHESGVVEDSAQKYMSVWLNDPQHRAAEIVTQMRTRKAPKGASGSYVYSNDNYALLALVIEDVAGAPYAETCQERVLVPAGVDAGPSDKAGAFLSWGGWAMPVEDYLKFHTYWFHTDAPHMAEPNADLGGGAFYGLGMLKRPMNGGANHWHVGALCFPGQFSTGSLVVAFFNGWRAVLAYDTCADWPMIAALYAAIVGAVFDR